MAANDEANTQLAEKVNLFLREQVAEIFGNSKRIQSIVWGVGADGHDSITLAVPADHATGVRPVGMEQLRERLQAAFPAPSDVTMGVDFSEEKPLVTFRIHGTTRERLGENAVNFRMLNYISRLAQNHAGRYMPGGEGMHSSSSIEPLAGESGAMRVSLSFRQSALQDLSVLEPLKSDLRKLFPSARGFSVESWPTREGGPGMRISFAGRFSELAQDIDRREVPLLLVMGNDNLKKGVPDRG